MWESPLYRKEVTESQGYTVVVSLEKIRSNALSVISLLYDSLLIIVALLFYSGTILATGGAQQETVGVFFCFETVFF